MESLLVNFKKISQPKSLIINVQLKYFILLNIFVESDDDKGTIFLDINYLYRVIEIKKYFWKKYYI